MSYTDYLKELLRPLGVYDVDAPFNGGELTAAGRPWTGPLARWRRWSGRAAC